MIAMSYMTAIETMPRDLQMPMLKVLDAFQRDMREQLAVRRDDFDEFHGITVRPPEAQQRNVSMTQRMIDRQDTCYEKLVRYHDRLLETHFRDRAHAYFGRLLRKVQVVSLQDLEEEFESRLDDREWEDVSLLDLVVRGQAAQHPERPDILLAFEISAVIDRGDVERSLRRSALLRKTGFPVVSGVAGEYITQGALEAAQKERVFVVQNGHKDFWEEALAAALAA
jgi:hypothetical protein